jgi:hypothetical protein
MNYKYTMFKNQYLVLNEYNGMYSLIKASYNQEKDSFWQQWGSTKDGKRPFGITLGKTRQDLDALIEFLQEVRTQMPGNSTQQTEKDDIPF